MWGNVDKALQSFVIGTDGEGSGRGYTCARDKQGCLVIDLPRENHQLFVFRQFPTVLFGFIKPPNIVVILEENPLHKWKLFTFGFRAH